MYRRRRLAALLVLLLVAGGLVWAVTTLLGSGDGETGDDSETPETQVDGTEEPTGHPERCAVSDLDVVLAHDAAEAAPGSGVTFDLALTNTGQRPCLIDAGTAGVTVSVTSGDDLVWSSAHCLGEVSRELLLDAGMSRDVQVAWPGTRSAQGCPGGQPAVSAGTYRVQVEIEEQGVEVDGGTRFELG